MRYAYKIVVRKPERNRPFERQPTGINAMIQRKRSVDEDLVLMLRYRTHWLTVVNMVLKLGFHKCKEFLD
jgi:hypothetical protein